MPAREAGGRAGGRGARTVAATLAVLAVATAAGASPAVALSHIAAPAVGRPYGATPASGRRTADLSGIDLSTAARCDPASPERCLLPWPNDYFTRADRSSPTGLRLSLDQASMPRNVGGVPINASDYNRSDGFSPGQPIVIRIPGFDSQAALDASGAAPVTDIGRSLRQDQPIVVVDARTGRRQPLFAEVDSTAPDDAHRALIVRPAVNWREGHRYVVAIRGLRTAGGSPIAAPRVFAAYRDGVPTGQPVLEARRQHVEGLLRRLGASGIPRRGLYLAWDFTVASRQGLSARALAIRDDAFAALGDTRLADLRVEGASPRFAVSSVQDFTEAQNALTARRVRGTVEVPCYLDAPGCPPGSRFALRAGGLGLPLRTPGNVIQAPFVCDIPRSAFAPDAAPARPVIYGHGLLGSPDELTAPQFQRARNDGNLVFCGTPWIGMAAEDVPNVAAILQDLSRFPSLADRLQQAHLDFAFLGRALIHPEGFSAGAAFRRPDGRSVIDTRRLYYNGNSQGGILGGAQTALGVDFDRAVLGVPGMNFSTLLQRSVDFAPFAPLLSGAYPDAVDRQLALSMIQILWDRGEADGYAWHMTRRPLPNTPAKRVVLLEAFGDHQVSNVATEVEARTIGARLRTPALDPGRSIDAVPFWGIRTIPRFPFRGSALVLLDIGPLRSAGGRTLGTPPAPPFNLPPAVGNDPHGSGGDEPWVYDLAGAFFQPDGVVTDPCAARPCYADGWTGP